MNFMKSLSFYLKLNNFKVDLIVKIFVSDDSSILLDQTYLCFMELCANFHDSLSFKFGIMN